jgi:hypothetical protein
MKKLTSMMRHAKRRARQKGSALLVSLMAMVGLSLLGLAFIVLSETESAISINEQNHTQTVAVAEAGAKLVLQWFQDPVTMRARGLMPVNVDTIKTSRTVSSYHGYYKPASGGSLLCELPYGPKSDDQFYGEEGSADIWITRTNGATFLNALNTALFPTNETGRITDIRIYAPPIVGGTLTADGTGHSFWLGGQPYGTATIRVTAEKLDPAGNVGAQAVVRLVVAPFPLPGPTGALQALGQIGSHGTFNVNWGAVESQNSVNLSKEYTSLPWFDSYDRAHIERGYDSSTVWTAGTVYTGNATIPLGDTVRPSGGPTGHEYVATTSGTSGPSEPSPWPTTDAATYNDNGIIWQERKPTMYPLVTGTQPDYENHKWLFEVVNHDVQDPWFQARSWLDVQGNGTTPHPFPYAQSPPPASYNCAPPTATCAGYTHYFQYQTLNLRPDYRRVDVPKFDYNFWKSAAIAGRGQKGVHYLTYTAGSYTDGITTQPMNTWLSGGNGFYFFETTNGLDPQHGGPGTLDPSASDPCGFKGFAYTNLVSVKSTGCTGSNGLYPQPGEPYRDVGYRQVVETSAGLQVRGQWATDAAGNAIYIGAYNAQWDYQDLDWSNSGTAGTSSPGKNGIFDVYIARKQTAKESGGTFNDWVPVEYFPGCFPGNNSTCPGCNCSEPHEPYLNIRYTGIALGFQHPGDPGIQAGWSNPAAPGGQPKKTTPNNFPNETPVVCTAADVASKAGQANCTSNAYDIDGGLATIAPGIVGVLYNEGDFDSTGNGEYFGSLVLGDNTNPKGTCNIWFDERLVKGGWPPPGVTFPRVMVTSEEIQ